MKSSRWSVLFGFVAAAGLATFIGAQATAPQTKTPEDPFLKGAYTKATPGITAPVTIHEVKPRYTPDAMRAKVQGSVKLQLVVAADGTVDRVRVLESLDSVTGLDEAAVVAAKQWKFKPGELAGKAVPVAIDIVLEFRLH